MLSALQADLLALVADTARDARFAFAGAGALSAIGAIDRETRDLDFSATSPAHVNELHPRLVAALRTAGLVVHDLQVADGFVRLEVKRGDEQTLIDLGWDARDWPTEPNPAGPVPPLAFEELAASKVLALDSRAEPRDFVDAFHLDRQLSRTRLLQLAKRKDPGFSVAYFREAHARFDRLPSVDFPIDDAGYQALTQFVRSWRAELEPPTPPTPSLGL